MTSASTTVSTSRRPLGLSKAVGLQSSEIRHQWGSSVVIHDPMTDQYHRLRTDEAMLLFDLTPEDSLQQLVERYRDRYPDHKMTAGHLHSLFIRWAEMGLIRGNGSGQGAAMLRRAAGHRRRRWLQQASSWLFWRLPGVDPSPAMRWWMPIVRPLLSPFGLAVATIWITVSAIAFVLHREAFVAQWPSLSDYLTWQHAIMLAFVVAGTKVAHEWGHATVSEHLGARCRMIGPMWLVLTPALYCDVSPSWMLPSRWRRIAIGCAGMATEGLLASAAVWIWLATPPGTVHAIAAHVILVCGIGTLFFNANPLLRYDGYYILSDVLDVPNLGQRAKRRLGTVTRRLVLGIEDQPTGSEPADRSWWMLCYGLAAMAMRWLVILTILWALVQVLRPLMLERVGMALAVSAAAAMTVAGTWPLVQWWRRPSNRRRVRWRRVVFCGLLLAATAGAFLWPLPSSVTGECRWIPARQHHVFVTTPGTLSELKVQPGEIVRKGDTLAQMTNWKIEDTVARATGRVETQRGRIESLRLARSSLNEASDLLPDARAMLRRLQTDLEAAQRQQRGLILKAPIDGLVVPTAATSAASRSGSPNASTSALFSDADRDPTDITATARLASWTGRPTDPENQGCFLSPGTELLSIVSPDRWKVEVVVPKHRASRIRLGSLARVFDTTAPDVCYVGRVADISRVRYHAGRDGLAHDEHRDSGGEERSSRSIVAIEFDQAIPEGRIVGGSGRVKIDAEPRSLVAAITERVARLFRFR